MLTKLTLGEKLKDLRIAKGYKSTEQLASVVNIPKTTLNDYENDERNQDVVQKLKDFKGSPQEMKLKLFTLILGTDINKLNGQEIGAIRYSVHLHRYTRKQLTDG